MKPQRSAALAISALLSGFFTACENSESVQADDSHPKALQGVWKEVPRENVIRFAGGDFMLTFGTDGVSIREKNFTDASICIETGGTRLCSDFNWENTYRGTWKADDSLLTLSITFAGTTANSQTEDERMPDGTYRMRYDLRGPGLLTLSARSGDAPLPHVDSLKLSRD